MLHERVRHDNEVAGDQGAEKDGEGRPEVRARTEALFSEEEEAKKARLEKEGEESFHRERLPDHAAREVRELGPVRPELELERDSRHDAGREVEPENASPEARALIVPSISCSSVGAAERHPFEDDDQERESHRELREE